jgi:hypothetical protein
MLEICNVKQYSLILNKGSMTVFDSQCVCARTHTPSDLVSLCTQCTLIFVCLV